jgi:hypothetical protein
MADLDLALDVARVERQVRRVAFLDDEELPSVGEGSVMATPGAAVAEAILRLFIFVAIVVVTICVGIGFMRSMLLTFAFAEQMGVRERKRVRRKITRQKSHFKTRG